MTMKNPDEIAELVVESISIVDGSRATFTGAGRMHGLGAVGDPLRPYLDHRNEGYLLILPDDLRELKVWERDYTRPPLKSGKQPRRWLPLSALGADDVRLPAVESEAK